MSALPQPDFRDVNSFNSPILRNKTLVSDSVVNTSGRQYSRKTTRLSRKKRSATLKLLILLQKGSFGVAAVGLLSCLGVYSATVRIPQLWSTEYESLEALQRQERQLIALDEALKYEIARGAEQPESEMSAISDESTIFLESTAVEPQKVKGNGQKRSLPLGY